MSWFRDAHRKAHVLYVSPDWVPNRGERFDAEKMALRMKEAHISSIELYAKDHHGFCYYDAHVGPRYPIDVLGGMVERGHVQGIPVVAYFSVGYDNYAAAQHPDWTCRDEDGRQIKTRELFAWLCFSSGYAGYMLDQIREIVRYEVDGLWLDILGFFWFRFPSAYATAPYKLPRPTCYCANCRTKFEERFNADLTEPSGDSHLANVRLFHREANISFLRDVRTILKARRPDALLSFNWSGIAYSPEAISLVDYLSAEAHPPDYLRQGFTCRHGRSSGKPYQMHTAGSLSGWSAWDTKPLSLLLLESSIALAHGGSPNVGLNPYPDGSWEEGQLRVLEELFGYVEVRENYLREAEGVAQVALMYGDAPDRPSSAPFFVDRHTPLIGFNEVLTEEHYQFEFTDGSKGLEKYRLVIVPEQPMTSAKQLEDLRAYVKNGGNLILTYDTSLFDAEGKQLPNFALAEVMGLDYVGLSPYSGVYAALEKPLTEGLPEQPIVFSSPAIETRGNGAEKLASLIYPLAEQTTEVRVLWGGPTNPSGRMTDSILAGLNRYGRGKCLYLAVPLGRDIAEKATVYGGISKAWWKRLAANAARLLLPDDLVQTDAPPGVEVVLNRLGDRYVLHLVNHYVGWPSYLASNEKAAALNITLDLQLEKTGPISKASLVSGEKNVRIEPLQTERVDDWLRVRMPGLKVYSMVVLE